MGATYGKIVRIGGVVPGTGGGVRPGRPIDNANAGCARPLFQRPGPEAGRTL